MEEETFPGLFHGPSSAPTAQTSSNGHIHLPTTTLLEWYALAGLRALATYRLTASQDGGTPLAGLQDLTRNLHALGYALEKQHLESWSALIQQCQDSVRRRLNDNTTADDVLYGQVLALLLDLRHSPYEVRLAHPGLGRQLITTAVCVEWIFLLDSDPGPPAPPSCLDPLSRRDQLLLDVARQVAVLEFEDRLLPGHRLTPAELLAAAQAMREAVQTTCQEYGWDPGPVWASSERQVAKLTLSPQEKEESIYSLYSCLELALVTGANRGSTLSSDGALALCLERTAANLTSFPLVSSRHSGAGRKDGVLLTQLAGAGLRRGPAW